MKKCNYMEFEKFHKDLRKGFKPHTKIRVNPSEVSLLKLIEEKSDQSFRYYGRKLKLEKSSFSYIVDLLELKELVVKKEDEKDRRQKSLQLTEKGKELVKELNIEFDEYLDVRFSDFSEEDMKKLNDACKTIERLNKILEGNRPIRHRPEHE